MNKSFHLSTYMMALTFGSVLLVSALFAYSSYVSTNRIVAFQTESSLEHRNRLIQLSLNDRFDLAQYRLESLTKIPQLVEAVRGRVSNSTETLLFDLLREQEKPFFKALIVTDLEGAVIAEAGFAARKIVLDQATLAGLSKKPHRQWRMMEVPKRRNVPATPLMIYSLPVFDPVLNEVTAYLHATVNLRENRDMLLDLQEMSQSFEIAILYNGNVLADAKGGMGSQFLGKLSKDQTNMQMSDDFAFLISPLYIQEPEDVALSLLTVIQSKNTSALESSFYYNAMMTIFWALLSAFVIGVILKHLVGKSANRLLNCVNQVLEGKKSIEYPDGPVQEFNVIGEAFSQIVANIHENERYLTNLIEQASSPIIAWDRKGWIKEFNRAAQKLLDCRYDEAIALNIIDVLPAITGQRGFEQSIFERSIAGEGIDHWEMTHHNEGRDHQVHISWSISPVAFFDTGLVQTVLAQGIDVTQLKNAQEELRRMNEELEIRVANRTTALKSEIQERRHVEYELLRSKERFRAIAEVSSDWFWEMGPDLRFTYMSRRAADITGLPTSEIIGKTRLELVDRAAFERDKEKWLEHESLLRRHEPFRGFEYPIKSANDDVHVFRVSGLPIFDPETNEFMGYYGSGRDVTADYMRASELQKAKDEAESASQAKSEFLSSMSHELRTPLNGILGFAQLMLLPSALELDEKQKEYVKQIANAGSHLLDLINDILDLARIEAKKVGTSIDAVEPVEVILDACTLLEKQASDNSITLINAAADKKIPPVCADYTRLKQILMNLGSNAIKYNSPSGRATFDCCVCSDENMIEFSVIDTGKGIAKDKQGDIFLPFNRLGAEFSNVEGTGIGLTITQKLVELMDGKIGVESDDGQGSRFWFRLPVYTQMDVPIKSVRERSEAKIKNGLKVELATTPFHVLYVEDNPNNQTLVEEALSCIEGLRLRVERTAEEGLDYLKSAEVDLVLLDINLPGMSGWDMMKIINKDEALQSIPVAALTAQAMEADMKRGKELGFAAYLSKPIHIGELFAVIQEYSLKKRV